MRSADGQLAGVAGGLANYFDIDVTIIRLLFVLFTLMGGPGILVYIIMAIVMPEEGKLYHNNIDMVVEKEPVAA